MLAVAFPLSSFAFMVVESSPPDESGATEPFSPEGDWVISSDEIAASGDPDDEDEVALPDDNLSEPSFLVTIPSDIDNFDEEGVAQVPIYADGLEEGTTLVVTFEGTDAENNAFVLSNMDGEGTLPYMLLTEYDSDYWVFAPSDADTNPYLGEPLAFFDEDGEASFSLTANPADETESGSYTGRIDYGIEIVPAADTISEG
jgi:hypothetical protein